MLGDRAIFSIECSQLVVCSLSKHVVYRSFLFEFIIVEYMTSVYHEAIINEYEILIII